MQETFHVKANIEKKGEEFLAIASTAAVDRQGEIVEVSGWDLKDFKKNPVLQWAHDHSVLPVGKAEKIWIEGEGKNAKLMFKPVFQEVTEFGRAVKQLVQEGFLNAFSVGFIPLDGEDNRFTKQKLLEISVVNVPANPEALMLGYKSLKDNGYSDETIEKAGIPVALVKEISGMRKEMNIMKSQIDSAVNGLKHLNPHIGRNNRVTTERLNMAKVVARASDKMLAEKKADTRIVKTIKRVNDELIVSLKGELNNGKNQRTSGKS